MAHGLRFIVLGLLLPGAGVASVAGAAVDKPNIVLIYADDVGYGDLSCYGAKRVETPNLDRLAADGLRFTDGHSSSATCTPSRYSLLTGEYAWRRRGTSILPGDAPLIIEPGRTTLPSLLQQAGYATAAIGKWHLGLGDGKQPLDWNGRIAPGPLEVGFDRCFLIPATGDRVPCVYVRDRCVAGADAKDPIRVSYDRPLDDSPTGRDRPDLLVMRPSHGHDQSIVGGISRIGYMSGGVAARWVDADMADVLTAEAVAFVEEVRERPFFLYFATHDIHVPRVPHPRFTGTTEMGPRGDAIVQLDACVGRVLDALDRGGQAENTLVIFTSDNGPVVDDGYRDGAVKRLGDHRPAGPWRGGKYSSFEGGTRVPWIARWTGRVNPGVSDALVSQVDLMASLAALVGVSVPAGAASDSVDVLAALLGEAPTARDELVEHAGVLALRASDWKLIGPSDRPQRQRNTGMELGNSADWQLYNLHDDSGETTNLAERHPEKVKDLAARLEAIRTPSR